MVPLDGLLDRVVQLGSTLAILALVLVRVVEGDAGLGSQELDRRHEVELFLLSDEGDGVALGLATEAVIEALLSVDRERGRLLGVERAEPGEARADTAQLGVVRDDLHDVNAVAHPHDVFVDDPHDSNLVGRGPEHCLSRGQSSDRNPKGRAGHIVQAGLEEQPDAGRVTAVFPAHPNLDAR